VDTIHTLIGAASLTLLAAGAWLAWGVGYAAIVTGAVLLAGVIYARTR
jgi:hypothetical protein